MGNTVGSQLREIVIGTLLGDSFLEQDGNHKRFVCGHSLRQEQYILWKYDVLSNLIECKLHYRVWKDPRNSREYASILLRSATSPIWDEFYDMFYKDHHRIIPRELPKIISPQVLAVWLMDDGYRRNDCNAIRINTQAYDQRQHQIIGQGLMKLGINSRVHHQADQLVTYVPSSSMEILRKQVRPYMIQSMEYKIA